MRLLKTHPILGLLNSYMVDSPQPANISYMWNFGSLLGLCLILQLVTGITLAMHYNPSVDIAFISVEHIIRDVNYGYLIRYVHANVASFFFIFVYLHIGRGLYYGSYRSPRVLAWSIGVIILVLMIGTAFLGYVLPYGQMSLWGATVITNLLSAIPWIGQDFVQLVWGGFSVNNATLNRFFSLHYLLPFILAALAAMHLLAVHEHGSSNPLGYSGNSDRLAFHPYFVFKDLVTVIAFLLVLFIFVCYFPNFIGHSDNYIPANPMQTPPSIVPEWYLLPYYAILRSIPDKLLGVVAMLASLLILLIIPLVDFCRIRGAENRPLMRFLVFFFGALFILLLNLGSKHVEAPYVLLGQIGTVLYFSWFLVFVPLAALIENTLINLSQINSSTNQ
jgi:ubiquinol-cytochrome c reductase cytochrome b subunit